MTIKNVAVTGASGNLGPSILAALVQHNFNVTVLARPTSTATYPPPITLQRVDFSSAEALTTALKGQDALISVRPITSSLSQIPLIDAAIASETVKRFIPSEFGGDPENPKVQSLPFIQDKDKVVQYLKQKAAEGDKISYTLIANGAILDWGLKAGFLANFKPGAEFQLQDGGDVPFAATRLVDIGKAIAEVLEHAEETKNRTVRIKSVVTTNKKLLAIGKKLNPDLDVKIVHVNTEQLEKEGREVVRKAEEAGEEVPRPIFGNFARRMLYGEEFNGALEPDDNELLGIKFLSDEEFEALVAPFVTAV